MAVTGVYVVHNATPNNMTAFHDKLSAHVPILLGKWGCELKLFKSNTQTLPSDKSKFLYNIVLGHESAKQITLVDKTVIVTTTETQKRLVESGSSNGSSDNFDHLIQTKLQSLWLLRQTLKGEGGYSFKLESGDLILRTVNIFLHGNFKAFLIIVEYHGKDPNKKRLEDIAKELEFPAGRLSVGALCESQNYYGDLGYQFVDALQL